MAPKKDYNFNVCRVCLLNNKNKKFISLYKDKNMLEQFAQCFGTKLSKDRQFHRSVQICKPCAKNVSRFCEIAKNVQEIHKETVAAGKSNKKKATK